MKDVETNLEVFRSAEKCFLWVHYFSFFKNIFCWLKHVYSDGMLNKLFSFLYREFPYLSLCLSIQSPPSSESHYKQSNFSVDIPQLNIRSLVSNFEALFKMIGTSGPNCSENGLP